MHVTFAFLGSVEDGRLPAVLDAVREGCRGRAPFDVSLEGLGRFPGEGSPRIVWLGIVRGAPELIRLADGLRTAIARRELPLDAKPFRAHVTLARVGDRADHATTRTLASAVARARTPALGFRAERVVCFESVVSAKGPRYTPRATVSLGVAEER
jgi:2'-5' RNA ligase